MKAKLVEQLVTRRRGYYCWVGVSAPRTADDAVELESDDDDEELSVAMV